MNITGSFYIFVNEKEYENEKGVALTRNTYSTSISRYDDEADEYINAYLDVVFSNNLKEAWKLDKSYGDGDVLKVEVSEGWLTPNVYTNSKGDTVRKVRIFINGVDDISINVPDQPQAKKAAPKSSSPQRTQSKTKGTTKSSKAR